MPLNRRENSRFFRPAVDGNEEILDHVRVHVEANEKSKIPKQQKRQLEDMPYRPAPYIHPVYPYAYPVTERDEKPHVHVNIETEKRHQVPSRQRRDLATEYTKNIVVPDRAENNLGVVQQKRVEEAYESSGKRNKILKLDKRDVFMPNYWEPRATIRGSKVIKNPILQLLRAAAGQKTQRILGLNSKAFDIFPGPLPDEQNVAIHNNLGKVTSEPPANQYRASVDQQIMRSFRRPFRRQRYMAGRYQPVMSMYPQASQQQRLPQQIMEQEQPLFQQREYTPMQQQQLQEQHQQQPLFQQREYTPMQQQQLQEQHQQQLIPEQEMSPLQADPQPQGIFQERDFSRFSPFTRDPRIRQQYSAFEQERPQYREMMMPRQLEMFQRSHPVPMEEMMPREEQAPQQMFMRPNSYSMEQWPQRMFRPESSQEMTPQTRSQYQPYPPYQNAPQSDVSASPRGLSSSTEVLKAPSLPEMKFDRDSGMFMEPSLEHSNIPGLIAEKAVPMSPLEESQQMTEGSLREIPSSLPMMSNKLYQLPSSFSTDRRYLPELSWLNRARPSFSSFVSQPYMHSPAVSPRHALASHIPRVSHIPHPDDDDDFDEKPEVHVHIQTEKSRITKPTESDMKSFRKAKNS